MKITVIVKVQIDIAYEDLPCSRYRSSFSHAHNPCDAALSESQYPAEGDIESGRFPIAGQRSFASSRIQRQAQGLIPHLSLRRISTRLGGFRFVRLENKMIFFERKPSISLKRGCVH